MTPIQLVGLDFGTTTSSAVIAEAELVQNSVTGKRDLGHVEERFRSEMIFTPWREGRLDLDAVERSVASWLHAGGVRREQIFGGGALLTGLTAQADNAARLVALIRRYVGDAFVATADDPCLESWLAFHGSCGAWSRAHPETPILNLDIGGGTTNAALGLGGEVRATGCVFVGARHVQVRPGGYEITGLSRYARALFDSLHIPKDIGDCLALTEVDAIIDMQMRWLEALVSGRREAFADSLGRFHEQVPLPVPPGLASPIVTVSGGVGELLYAHLQGRPRPATTAFGDLGIELARRLLEHSPWSEGFRQQAPASCGRATVYGLLRHSTQVSGSTVFLSDPDLLPLSDVPIFGRIGAGSTDEHLAAALAMVKRSARGGGLAIDVPAIDAPGLSRLGERLARKIAALTFAPGQPLVMFASQNVGKILGQLMTRWGQLPLRLLVVDEIDVRDAQYAHLGAIRNQVIPVSVFGLR